MMFESEFCRVEYREDSRAVFLRWKKACCGENYREPVRHVLKLAREHAPCGFLIDARSGFEDEPADVEWGFAQFIPQLSQAGCTGVVLIMHSQSDIEGEMDMWSSEFQKYFPVFRVSCGGQAAARLAEMASGRPPRKSERGV